MGNHGRHRSTNQANSPDRRSQRSRVSITRDFCLLTTGGPAGGPPLEAPPATEALMT